MTHTERTKTHAYRYCRRSEHHARACRRGGPRPLTHPGRPHHHHPAGPPTHHP
nr:MAG TPA: hypothetical protein [Caudoviricetes sp.]